MRRRASAGFTLIELLVVVAIIAVLIAILLPSLGRAKANAVRVKCQAVLKQWGAVCNLYSQEYDGYFGIKSGSFQWNNGIYDPEWQNKYTVGMRNCPGDPTYGSYWAGGSSGASVRPTLYEAARYIPVQSNKTMWKMSEFNHPSSTMFLCDAAATFPSGKPTYSSGTVEGDFEGIAPSDLKTSLEVRHLGKGNTVFLDGHAENVVYQDYLANIAASGSNPPTGADIGKVWTLIATP